MASSSADVSSSSASSNSLARTETVGASGVSDLPALTDNLGFGPYVTALAAFLIHEDTKPPLTVSVEGSWGSGKSSFMRQLEAEILNHSKARGTNASRAKTPITIRFNAWRLDKGEAVWAAFALAITKALADASPSVGRRVSANLKLRAARFDWGKGWFALSRAIVVAVFLIYTAIGVLRYFHAHPAAINPFSETLTTQSSTSAQSANSAPGVKPPDAPKPEDALIKLVFASLGSAGYILLAVWVLQKAFSILGNPFTPDIKKNSLALPYEEQTPFIERFHQDFQRIIKTYSAGRPIFIFIDDLDRCDVPRATELIQAINLLMGESPQVVHILGIDRQKIAAGLASKYHDLLPFLYDMDDGKTAAAGIDFGYSYLEKFIQIPFQVPHPTSLEIDKFLRELNKDQASSGASAAPPVAASVLFETKVDSPLVRQIVLDLAPALEFNPRRVKQFINQFRLSAIIGTQTGLFRVPRRGFAPFTPQILGKLLVIVLRWPRLISDALANPSLLELLETSACNYGNNYDPIRNMKPEDAPVSRFWIAIKPLRSLLTVGLQQGNTDRVIPPGQSLANIDLQRFLQVAPAIQKPTATPQPAAAPIRHAVPEAASEARPTSFADPVESSEDPPETEFSHYA